MSSVQEIEQAVERLSPDELRAFREWFAEHDAAEWDRQFEADVAAGRLNALADKAGSATTPNTTGSLAAARQSRQDRNSP